MAKKLTVYISYHVHVNPYRFSDSSLFQQKSRAARKRPIVESDDEEEEADDAPRTRSSRAKKQKPSAANEVF